MTALDVALDFMLAINAHDLRRLNELMTDDHQFIDSLGQSISGRDAVLAGWRGYLGMCPDYWVAQEETLCDGDRAAIFGFAGGRIAGTAWRIPAAWRVRIVDGRVALWQVYADNKPVYEILAGATGR